MFPNARPQPCSPRQELEEISASPPEVYEFGGIPFVSSGHLPAAYEQPQSLAINSDENIFTEELFLRQFWLRSTLPLYPEANVEWQKEADVSSFGYLPEKQILDRVEPIPQTYSEDSDVASSGQSSPSIFGGYPSSVADSPPPPYEAPHGSSNLEFNQSTPEISPDKNWDTQPPSRYHMENSSPSTPTDTLFTQLLAGRDSNPIPDYSTTDSNYQPPNNYRYAQPGDQQDINTVQHKCEGCNTPFKRAGDLQRHFDTTKIHGLAKGPSCPIGGCKYPNKNFTRVDNFKAHLVKRHSVHPEKAARIVRRWKERRRSYRYSLKTARAG